MSYISGIRTPKEDVLMNSVPITTRDEKAPFRISGGWQTTGQQDHPGQSTMAGPSTLTSLLHCWTLAPPRLKSLPRTRVLHLSDQWIRTPWRIRTGTGKRRGCQRWLGSWSGCFLQSHGHTLLLMEKSGLANHKLTVGKGIYMYPLYQQHQTVLLFSPQWMWLWIICSLKEEVCFLLSSSWWTKRSIFI